MEKEFPPQLRQHFFGHVVGPIGHHIVVRSIDEAKFFLSTHITNPALFSNLFTGLVERNAIDSTGTINSFADGIRRAFSLTSPRVYGQSKFPLTKNQVAMLRFLEPGKRPIWYVRDGKYHLKKDGLLTMEGNTVVRALQDIAFRTKGLEVKTLSGFIALAKRPEIHDIFRALMSGGPSFDSFIRTKPGEPAPYIFDDFQTSGEHIAYIDEEGKLQINPRVKELSGEYRKKFNALSRTSTQDNYYGNAAGCPLKGLTFLQHTALLDQFDVALTDEQIEVLVGGENPTALNIGSRVNTPDGKNVFRIQRDGISEMLDMCISYIYECVEVMNRELIANPENEHLRGNVGLLIGESPRPGELVAQIEAQVMAITLGRQSTALEPAVLGDSFARCPIAH